MMLWQQWLKSQIISKLLAMDFGTWVRFNLSRSNVLIDDVVPWPTFFAFGCWLIWKSRKKLVFDGAVSWSPISPELVLARAKE